MIRRETLAARRRRYLTTTCLRMACLGVAGIVFGSWWLAAVLVALMVPLPWIAVLTANADVSPDLASMPSNDRDH